jgi:hypothetical protein
MSEQKPDYGYRAVVFEVGDSLEKAMKENAELKGRLELWRKSEEGTLAQMAETNERFEGALSTIRELEAQLAEANANIESLDAALENSAAEGILWIEKTARAEMRAEAAEARAEAKDKEWLIAYHKWYEAEARAQAAGRAIDESDHIFEAENAKLRKALETIRNWPFDIRGDCVADARKLAQAALASRPTEQQESEGK